jgi:hypothetical protein
MSSMVGAGLSGATSPDASRTAPIGRRPPAALSTERLATSGRIRNRDGTA